MRFIGDAAIAAFFAADKDKAREQKRLELADRIADYLAKGEISSALPPKLTALRGGQFPVTPFHWEIEYPEVFDRENPGFDGIVGNPPFAGGSKVIVEQSARLTWTGSSRCTTNRMAMPTWLLTFSVVRSTICDEEAASALSPRTRLDKVTPALPDFVGYAPHGGTIYAARKRYKWPGQAAVVVSVVWTIKGSLPAPYELDGRNVTLVSAYLFHAGGHETPSMLATNSGKSFTGSKIYGQGFVFDDEDSEATPLSEMQRLIGLNASNQERVFPYIGGEEVNDNPLHLHRRFVINFADYPLRRAHLEKTWADADNRERDQWLRAGVVPMDYPTPVAADWPDLLAIVEAKVKPERMILRDTADGVRLRERWWLFGRSRPELAATLANKNRSIVCCLHQPYWLLSFLPTGVVCSHALGIFAFESAGSLGLLQSRVHEVWVRLLSSSMKDDIRYTGSDCFETFPFPAEFETNATLEATGREYYEFRAALMQDLWLGLTDIYNLFHSPDDEALARLEALYRKRAAISDWRTAEAVPADRSPLTLYTTPAAALDGVRRLRTLHACMDTAVLAAYGWTDLLPKCTCEFLLDYEDDESESGPEETGGRKKKKPWRYRWPDEVRDEVLARLLKLNAERANEERLAGLAVTPAKKPARKPKGSGISPTQPELLPPPQGDLFS